MNRGKKICKELRAVRRNIADENGIPLEQPECTHEGDCRGTCPQCEAEVRYLEQALSRRLTLGRAATVAGLSLGLASCGGSTQPSLSVDTPLASNSARHDTTMVVTDSVPDSIPKNKKTGYEFFETDGFVDENDSSDARQPANNDIQAEGNVEQDTTELLGVIVMDDAEFPGGEDALYKFLADNIQYPSGDRSVYGTVVVVFTIETDGTITDPKIIRDIGGGYGEEVLRVVKLMPKWKPTFQSGIPVRSQYMLPVKFDLSND